MAKDRETTGKCLICTRKAHQRGLCAGHYMQAQRALKEAEKEGGRLELDAEMVRLGQILPAKHGPAAKPNPFMETWKAIRASIDTVDRMALPRLAS